MQVSEVAGDSCNANLITEFLGNRQALLLAGSRIADTTKVSIGSTQVIPNVRQQSTVASLLDESRAPFVIGRSLCPLP